MLDPTPAASTPPREDVRALQVHYRSPLAQELVEEVQGEYVQRYGGRDEAPVDPEEFLPPRGAFLVALVGDTSVGTVALRRHVPDAGDDEGRDGSVAELKRLYVRGGHRRRGYARAILRLAEEQARALGYRRVVLETGTEQPEAMALYAAEGYTPIPTFGYYRDAPRSRAFAKDL